MPEENRAAPVNGYRRKIHGFVFMPNQVLRLDSKDNVLIALTDLQRGAQILFDSQTFLQNTSLLPKISQLAQA